MSLRASRADRSTCPTLAQSATNFARTEPFAVRTVTVEPCSISVTRLFSKRRAPAATAAWPTPMV